MIKSKLYRLLVAFDLLNLSRVLACVAPTLVLLGALSLVGYGAQEEKPLTLTVIQRSDESFKAVVLEATLQNVSKRDITLNAQDPLVDYTITVTDQRGVPVPFSKRGDEIFSKDRIRRTRSIEVTLAPGEIRQDTLAIGDIYLFKTPGRYVVTIARRFSTADGSGSVSSKALEVLAN